MTVDDSWDKIPEDLVRSEQIQEGFSGSEEISERTYPICGAKKSQGGDECTLKAGWTTDHVGEEKYKLTVASLPISSTVMGCTSRKYRHGVSRRRSLLEGSSSR